jgi:hypothetical protein
MVKTTLNVPRTDFEQHYETYRGFLRYTLLFVAHVAVILALLAYVLL